MSKNFAVAKLQTIKDTLAQIEELDRVESHDLNVADLLSLQHSEQKTERSLEDAVYSLILWALERRANDDTL